MAEHLADRFIDALRKLEEARDYDTIVSLYAEDSEVGNIVAPEKFTGTEGARKFWTNYRDTFGEAHSEFRNRITTHDRAALEWTTTGTTTGGATFEYDGVSLIEFAGDKITRFRAYFNAEALGRQVTPEQVGAAG